MILDSAGNLVSSHHYMPFGEERPSGAKVDSNRNYFTGRERDFGTSTEGDPNGLDYMLARYYSSSLGRFMAVDPSRKGVMPTDPQSWNRYAYVRNNPLASVDPDGEADIYVFRPTQTSSTKAWDAIKAEAPKYGNTVRIFNGSSATAQEYARRLSQSGAIVIFTGHSVHDTTLTVGSVKLWDNAVGTMPSTTGVEPLSTPSVQASTVGIFACESVDLASQYTPDSFTSVQDGTNDGTTLRALDAAAAQYTDSLARNQRPASATEAAGGAVRRSDDPHDQGDQVVTTTVTTTEQR
jgi:RHS repeat-associated protein